MGLVKKTFVECDRCGASEAVPDTAALMGIGDCAAGWVRISAADVLCPACTAEYEVMVARHKVEVADFMGGK